jgi:hypothetical protein
VTDGRTGGRTDVPPRVTLWGFRICGVRKVIFILCGVRFVGSKSAKCVISLILTFAVVLLCVLHALERYLGLISEVQYVLVGKFSRPFFVGLDGRPDGRVLSTPLWGDHFFYCFSGRFRCIGIQ